MRIRNLRTSSTHMVTAAVFIFSAAAFVPSVLATPMLVTNGSSKVIGVTSLDVNGSIFDVAFSAGGASYTVATAALGPAHDFGTVAAARDALTALGQFLNSSSATAADMSWGFMDDTLDADIVLGFAPATLVKVARLDWGQPSAWGPVFPFNDTVQGQQFPNHFAWAIFQLVNVPEPTTLALMSLGLVGLGFNRRRRL